MKSICNLMKEAGMDTLDFFYYKNRPTVQKDGDRYEILNISLMDNDTLEITGIKVYPGYEHKLQYLIVDSTWRKTSVEHIKNIVKQELNKLYE